MLKIPVFFAKPYCSADKPHIENINGLIRQYIPKGKSFDEISDDEIRQIQNQLNNRPRKKLGYKTPYEVFFSYICSCVALDTGMCANGIQVDIQSLYMKLLQQ